MLFVCGGGKKHKCFLYTQNGGTKQRGNGFVFHMKLYFTVSYHISQHKTTLGFKHSLTKQHHKQQLSRSWPGTKEVKTSLNSNCVYPIGHFLVVVPDDCEWKQYNPYHYSNSVMVTVWLPPSGSKLSKCFLCLGLRVTGRWNETLDSTSSIL